MRVGLIACCKKKLDHAAPAIELYQSPLFKGSARWMNRSGRVPEWGILSAKYGLVMPDQVIEPYDLCLADLPRLQKERWADMVHEQLVEKWSEQAIWLVLMGGEYKAAVKHMPYVEDVIDCWTQWRMDKGMSRSRARMGIGVILKALKENWGYY